VEVGGGDTREGVLMAEADYISISVNDREVFGCIKGLRKKAALLPWAEIGDVVSDRVTQNFEGGESKGKQFARKKDGSPSYLQDTGALMESVAYHPISNGVEIGHGLGYGDFHVTGTRFMPVRDFLLLEDSVYEDDLGDLLAKHFEGEAGAYRA
jgi:phage gpG-like protein